MSKSIEGKEVADHLDALIVIAEQARAAERERIARLLDTAADTQDADACAPTATGIMFRAFAAKLREGGEERIEIRDEHLSEIFIERLAIARMRNDTVTENEVTLNELSRLLGVQTGCMTPERLVSAVSDLLQRYDDIRRAVLR